MAAIAGYLIVPALHINEVNGALELPEAIFKLDIPQINQCIKSSENKNSVRFSPYAYNYKLNSVFCKVRRLAR